MLNIFNNLIKFNSQENFTTNFSLNIYFIFYKYFYHNYNISFLKYSELLYVFKKFNINQSSLYVYLYLFIYNFTKIENFNIKFYSVLSNNSVLYFLNNTTSILNNLLISLKKNIVVSVNKINNSNYLIRYSPTNVAKYLHSNYLSSLNVLFLRKNKIFNKGRYSRNRQFYRTGVYWCLYINIIAIVGLYFWFYRFVMNFGYLWWLLFLSLASFVLAKSFNFNLLNIKNLINSIKLDLIFFSLLVKNIYNYGIEWVLIFFKKLNSRNFIDIQSIINSYTKNIAWFFFGFFNFFFKNPYIYLWSYNTENYYIYSITKNFNKVTLDSKKNKIFSEFFNMLLK